MSAGSSAEKKKMDGSEKDKKQKDVDYADYIPEEQIEGSMRAIILLK